MKRVVVVLGLVAIIGMSPAGLAAKGRVQAIGQRPGQTGDITIGQSSGDRQQLRAELERLRQELQRLQRELKAHEKALHEAQRAHDRVAAERESSIIKHIKDEIERIQHRIRELSHGK